MHLGHECVELSLWLCQLKLHLVKIADQVFRTLPAEQKLSYSSAVAALRTQYKLIAIKELHGWDFHHRVQGDESIKKLELQKLGHKEFPLPGKGSWEHPVRKKLSLSCLNELILYWRQWCFTSKSSEWKSVFPSVPSPHTYVKFCCYMCTDTQVCRQARCMSYPSIRVREGNYICSYVIAITSMVHCKVNNNWG